MKEPSVSVVLPTYNRADLLERSARSVLDQTYRDLELIVVDDGSTDRTADTMRGIADPRIRCVRLDRNLGAAGARNRGVRESRGEFVAFQDSDDEWLPEKLDRQMRRFAGAGPDVGVVYCSFWREQYGVRSYVPDPTISVREGDVHRQLLRGNFVSTQTVVARRSALEAVGPFDESLPPLEDWDMALRLAKRFHFALVDEPLVQSRVIADSISANIGNYIRGYTGIVDKHRSDLRQDVSLLARHYGTIGHCHCCAGHMAEGREWYRKAARLDPRRVQHRLGVILAGFGRGPYLLAARLNQRLFKREVNVPFLHDPLGRVDA